MPWANAVRTGAARIGSRSTIRPNVRRARLVFISPDSIGFRRQRVHQRFEFIQEVDSQCVHTVQPLSSRGIAVVPRAKFAISIGKAFGRNNMGYVVLLEKSEKVTTWASEPAALAAKLLQFSGRRIVQMLHLCGGPCCGFVAGPTSISSRVYRHVADVAGLGGSRGV